MVCVVLPAPSNSTLNCVQLQKVQLQRVCLTSSLPDVYSCVDSSGGGVERVTETSPKKQEEKGASVREKTSVLADATG